MPIGRRLYLSVLSLFIVFAFAFIFFQQAREKQYKEDRLNIILQDYNNQMHESFLSVNKYDKKKLEDYVKFHSFLGLRVMLMEKNGRLLFDNTQKKNIRVDYSHRPEIIQALKMGQGSATDRDGFSLEHNYFYSATYYPQQGYVICSALPYSVSLVKKLQTDWHYILFILVGLGMLVFILYKFINRLSNNIIKLNKFAMKADSGEELDTDDLMEFSDDELGDTAEQIIKLYMKLQKTKKKQEVLKRQLTQNVAHELKTPVASIQGYLETILNNPNIDEQTQRQFLERCYAQSNRLTALLNDMSTLNRMDDGADMMIFEEVDVAELIRTVQKESRFQLEQRGMEMECVIPEHILLQGNQDLLYSIFRNLTDNAIAYAGEKTKISLVGERQNDHWHFCFMDNGVGVPSRHLSRLFERFYRVDKGRSRKMGGTGLGLAIVKNAVLVHGGVISVKNNPQGGLCFDFDLKGRR